MKSTSSLSLSLLLLVKTAVLLPHCQAAPAPSQSVDSASAAVDATPTFLPLSEDDSMNFQMLVALAETPYRGADIVDVLKVANAITPNDMQSYSEAFYALANKTKAAAEDPYFARNPINVRDTYFAAANYYRNADFYLHGNPSDPLISELWSQQLKCFEAANAALPIPGIDLQLPASGGQKFTIEARYFAAEDPAYARQPCRRPTIILCNGYDGSQEDIYHLIGVAALERGFNVITYEGPGQPKVRRDQNVGFINEWETTLTPVVDYLYNRSDVDNDRIVYLGFSFGGYLAARAAAFEPRINALILDGGVYDVYEAFVGQLSPELLQLYQSGDRAGFDAAVQQTLASPDVPTATKWGIQQGLWSFNIYSPFDFLEYSRQFSIANIAHQITMPTWVANAQSDQFYQGQPPRVVEAIGPHATLVNFTGAPGFHVQSGANEQLNREMFAWIEATLNVTGAP